MNEEAKVVDVLILGRTLTGTCLENLLKGKLGKSCKIDLLDVAENGGIYQDLIRYASLLYKEREKAILAGNKNVQLEKINEDGMNNLVEGDKTLKKIFMDENMNVTEVGEKEVFPFGNIYKSTRIKNWLNELKLLSRYVPPNATPLQATQISSALENELDNLSVRDHMHKYVSSSSERRALEEMVWELCGVPTNKISLLYFLWMQRKDKRMCLRVKKTMKDDNLSHKVLAIKYQQEEDKILVQTDKGFFECSIVAMAIKPAQIQGIKIDKELLKNTRELEIVSGMFHGVRRGFTITYLRPFWKKQGYSGEIFSLSGKIRSTSDDTMDFLNNREFRKVYTLCGHLRMQDDVKDIGQFKDKVIEQLVMCFGPEAANPHQYIEENYDYIEIPNMGDFSELLKMLCLSDTHRVIHWSCMDFYNNCDLEGALLAAHRAYINIMYILRPQAVNFEDLADILPKIKLPSIDVLDVLKMLLWKTMNYKTASLLLVTSLVVVYFKYFHKNNS